MSTSCVPGKDVSATRPASGFVAFESLYQRTPFHSPTSSRRCSTPLKPAMASLIASSDSPAMRPTAAAARAFSRLCRPGIGMGGTGLCWSNHTTRAWVFLASRPGFVAAVDHREVVGPRELDDLSLDLCVPLERAVAVEVVGRDIEDHPDVQARPLHRLELEARELEHYPVLGRDLGQAVEDRLADVAADHHGPLARGEDIAGERGGRGLAVGACDADDSAGAQLQEQVDLARDGDALRARVVEELGVPRNAGAGVHDVDAREHAVVVAAEAKLGAFRKSRDGGLQLRAR